MPTRPEPSARKVLKPKVRASGRARNACARTDPQGLSDINRVFGWFAGLRSPPCHPRRQPRRGQRAEASGIPDAPAGLSSYEFRHCAGPSGDENELDGPRGSSGPVESGRVAPGRRTAVGRDRRESQLGLADGATRPSVGQGAWVSRRSAKPLLLDLLEQGRAVEAQQGLPPGSCSSASARAPAGSGRSRPGRRPC